MLYSRLYKRSLHRPSCSLNKGMLQEEAVTGHMSKLLFLCIAVLSSTVAAPPAMAASVCPPDKDSCVIDTKNAKSGIVYGGRLKPQKPDLEDVFGVSIALDSHTMAISAPWDSEKAYRAGAVYIFTKTGKTWKQTAKLLPAKPVAKAMFGSSMDIAGDTLVIGAPGERDDKLISAGAAYIYKNKGNDWTLHSRIVSEDILAGDMFGSAVTLAGKDVIVGAHLEDAKGIDSGAVYIFRESADAYRQVAKMEPKELRSGTLFGNIVDATGDVLWAPSWQPACKRRRTRGKCKRHRNQYL